MVVFIKNRSYNIFCGAYNIWQISKGGFCEKEALSHIQTKIKKKKTASKKDHNGIDTLYYHCTV